MSVTSNVNYQQGLSQALEEHSASYEDLVSNTNPLWAIMKKKGLMRPYSGPRIRQTLRIDKPAAQWFSGYDTLRNPPLELFNDCWFSPKGMAIPISLAMDEILDNAGDNQLMDVMESYLESAESASMDAMDAGIFSDGLADGGKQITGLAKAVPIVTNSGTYGDIDRGANAIWRTTTFDANSSFVGITQVTKDTIRPMLTQIFLKRSRGKRGADLLVMSDEHYQAYDASLVEHQRIVKDTSYLGSLGFRTMMYVGAGKAVEIVHGGGIGSNMPANTTFGLETDSFRIRYNPKRNFTPMFDREGQKPINQDAIAQFIGWRGELTQTNPLFNWRFYDSNPAA